MLGEGPAAHLVAHDCCCESHTAGALASGVHGTWCHLGHVLQQLRLGHSCRRHNGAQQRQAGRVEDGCSPKHTLAGLGALWQYMSGSAASDSQQCLEGFGANGSFPSLLPILLLRTAP